MPGGTRSDHMDGRPARGDNGDRFVCVTQELSKMVRLVMPSKSPWSVHHLALPRAVS